MNFSKSASRFGPYLIFIAALLWASDAPFRVHLTENLSSNFIVLIEHLISVVIILPFVFPVLRKLRGLTGKQWLAIIFVGVGGSAIALILFTEAFSYMNPSVAIVLQKLQPFIAISLAMTVLGERPRSRFWVWALVAIVGAYIISFPGLVPELYDGEAFNPHVIGVLLALGAAFFWGASTVLGKYLLRDIDYKSVTGLRFLVAFVFLILLNLFQGGFAEAAKVTATDWLYLLIIAITSGVVSLFIYYKGLQHTKASVATIAELGFVVGALVVNYIFLDATLTLVQLIGVGIVLFSIFRLSRLSYY